MHRYRNQLWYLMNHWDYVRSDIKINMDSHIGYVFCSLIKPDMVNQIWVGCTSVCAAIGPATIPAIHTHFWVDVTAHKATWSIVSDMSVWRGGGLLLGLGWGRRGGGGGGGIVVSISFESI